VGTKNLFPKFCEPPLTMVSSTVMHLPTPMMAPKMHMEIPMNVSNLPLADRYAAAKGALDAAQKAVDELKAEIKATGIPRLEGAFYVVEVGLSERATLDSKLVKEMLSAEQVAACTKVSMVETVRIKPMAATGK
jgi:hypothetical protein